MNMNTDELIELSKRVARLIGVTPTLPVDGVETYLHENSAFCFELMVAESVRPVVLQNGDDVPESYPCGVIDQLGGDELMAYRVAILRAVEETFKPTLLLPVAWMDKGETGNEGQPDYRVVTDAVKRRLPPALASIYSTPLYLRRWP
jgi:hypothetical protein